MDEERVLLERMVYLLEDIRNLLSHASPAVSGEARDRSPAAGDPRPDLGPW